MIKSEFWLQLIIFGMTAAIISLLSIRFFPSGLLAPKKALAEELISPVPTSFNISEALNPPETITIPSIDLHLPISRAVISGNVWTLFDDKVSWLSTSATAGRGNVILYAHNRPQLFGSLKNITIGDEITLEQNGKQYFYIVTDKHNVLPTDINAILSSANQLTLYTCDGTFDLRRLIVTAVPTNKL